MGINKLTCVMVILAVFIYGCTGNTTEPEKSIGGITGEVAKDISKPAIEENIKNEPKEEQREKTVKENANLPQEEYTTDQLVEYLREIFDAEYYNFSRDQGKQDYIRSSDLKYYVIHTPNKKINNAKEFCNEYCAANWNGWKYFINASDLEDLTPILGRNNFSNDARYREYVLERNLINNTFIEKTYEVENGKVLEYQFISWEQDQFNTFQGAWFGTFLIYKVYCSPNMTVFIRPKWDEFKDLSFPAATMSSTYKTWENYIKPVREELLGQANKLLGKCPVEKDFFKNFPFQEHYKTEMLSYHWKIDYEYLWNITSSIEVGVVPSLEEGKYILKEINISFKNDDEYDINEEINLGITVNPDGEGEQDYHDGGAGGKLAVGKSVERSMKKKDIVFSNNITVEAKLYSADRKGDIRPLKVTFTKADLGID